jgi:cell wall-associated NlpC family hydrolase
VLLIPKGDDIDKDYEDEIITLTNTQLKPWKDVEERYMLVKVAKSFIGAPYKYGGESLRGLDCSAFVKKIYGIFDVNLPRSAREQFKAGMKVSKEELAVGDLVFFRTRGYASYPTHVGIYIGEDSLYIHPLQGTI